MRPAHEFVNAIVHSRVVSRHYLGNFPAFEAPHYSLESPLELINYVILGFMAGAVAVMFIKLLYYSEDFFDRRKWPDYIKGAIGGLLIGIIGLQFPQIFGVGYDAMDSALSSDMVWKLALVLVLVKVIATSISLGSGGSGGIFAPSLFLGAMLGSFFGGLVNIFFPEWTADLGAYALVAMGGVVGAATHGPIAAILIIFELTSEYKIILPLMITTIIATLFAQRLHKESIYTLKLARKGISIFEGRETNVLRSLKVEDVVKQSIEVVNENESFQNVLSKVVNSSNNYIYVKTLNDQITGYISIQDIRSTLLDFDTLKDLLIAGDIANPLSVVIRERDNLDFVMKQFGRTDMDELPVLTKRNGTDEIIGSIRQRDVIEAYNHQIFLRDMSGETVQSLEALKQRKKVQVVDQYQFSEIEASPALIGKSLKDIDLRNAYNIEILLIRRFQKSKTEYIQPSGNTQIKMNDSLLIFGKANDISLFEKV